MGTFIPLELATNQASCTPQSVCQHLIAPIPHTAPLCPHPPSYLHLERGSEQTGVVAAAPRPQGRPGVQPLLWFQPLCDCGKALAFSQPREPHLYGSRKLVSLLESQGVRKGKEERGVAQGRRLQPPGSSWFPSLATLPSCPAAAAANSQAKGRVVGWGALQMSPCPAPEYHLQRPGLPALTH